MDEVNGMKWEHRCKICQMSKSHPDLFRDLHSQVLELGSNLTRAMHYVNSRIEAENIAIAKLNNINMSLHFSSHITIPDKVNVGIEKAKEEIQARETKLAISNGATEDVEAMVRRKVGNEVNDYLNLDSLRSQLTEKMQLIDEVVSIRDDNGKLKIDLNAVDSYTKLAKEIRSIIVDLNGIRQSRQLLNVVIKSLIERHTMEIMRTLLREYDQTKEDMIDAGVDKAITIKVIQNLKLKAAEVIAVTARAAVEDTLRLYKLG